MRGEDWRAGLAALRRAVGLTQGELARAVGVSRASIRAYEEGARNPSREILVAILDTVRVDRAVRNEILMSAGFAPDNARLSPTKHPDYYFTVGQALADMESQTRGPAR